MDTAARIVVDGKGNPVTDYTVRTEKVSGKQYTFLTVASGPVVLACDPYVSPAPTYSWSNHKMFWGQKAICNLALPMQMYISLWSGPELTQFQDTSPTRHGVGFTVSQDLFESCNNWGSFTYWKMYMYAQVQYNGVWINFSPYPGTHPPRWQECVDIN